VTTYLLRRLLLMLPVAFLVTVGVFMLIHLTPGDPALILLGEDRTPEAIAAIHHQLGLDQPLYVQYLIWLGHLAHGDLGRSYADREAVRTLAPALKFELPVVVAVLPPGAGAKSLTQDLSDFSALGCPVLVYEQNGKEPRSGLLARVAAS